MLHKGIQTASDGILGYPSGANFDTPRLSRYLRTIDIPWYNSANAGGIKPWKGGGAAEAP